MVLYVTCLEKVIVGMPYGSILGNNEVLMANGQTY